MHYAIDVNRYLCSDLVVLKTKEGESVVNLEEIWENGAALECEAAVESGSKLEMQAGETQFHGVATSVEHHEFGWRVEMEFSPQTPWSPQRFVPKHLLNMPVRNDE
jgi:hypothetical protein